LKSFGLDTTVVLRLLVGEPEEQAKRAFDFLDKCHSDGIDLHVSDLVVVETYHALVYHYEAPKAEAVKVLCEFISSPMIKASGHAKEVLSEYRGTGAGLADRMIRADYLKHTGKVVTFDADFAKLENVSRI